MEEGVNEKTISRRKDVYRVTEHIRVLIDLVEKMGVKFECKKDKRTEAQDRLTIKKVNVDGIEMNKQDIEHKGTLVHDMLLEKVIGLKQSSTTKIVRGDTEIMAILLE